MYFCLNALAKASPFDLGSPWVGVVLFGPVSLGSWLGGAWVPWRALPWSRCGFVAFVDPGSQAVALFHCLTCKTGFAQIHEDG